MTFNHSIKQKILIYTISVSVLLYGCALGFITMNSRNVIKSFAEGKVNQLTKSSANEVKRIFENELSLVRTLAGAFSNFKSSPHEQWKKTFLDINKQVLKCNPHIYSLWSAWENKRFIPNYTKNFGRFAIVTWHENNEIKWQYSELSSEGDHPTYANFKQRGIESIWEPYTDVATSGKVEAKLMVTFAAPIYSESSFAGIVGTDVALDKLQDIVSGIKPFENSYAFIVSNTGIIAGHPDRAMLNKTLKELLPDNYDKNSLLDNIQGGLEFTIIVEGEKGKELICFAPIKASTTQTPWSLAVSVPLSSTTQDVNKNG
jgi:methyl-accepting chemotaxis protein